MATLAEGSPPPVPASADKPAGPAGQVVLYSSLNEPTARSVIAKFEERTGIKVTIRSDTERDKTVGLVRTLIEEKDHPQADLFWNSEAANMIRLKEAGVLEALVPPPAGAEAIPAIYRDPENVWFGFAARARVIIVNTDLVKEADYPRSIFDLTDPRWKGKAGLVRPVTGTTLTHVTALYETLGAEKTDAFLKGVVANDCNLPAGNGRLAQLVGEGQIHFGLTDTSDYRMVKSEGKPVTIVYPDQDGLGTLLIPNTVARVKGGPNPENARKLIEYLLSAEAEKILAHHPRGHIPLKPGIEHPAEVKVPGEFKAMQVDLVKVGQSIEKRLEEMNQRFK
jgi:iron(III) transport system substrate-binding protein